MAEDKRFRIAGINYKDQPDNARRFLGRYGNPSPRRAPIRTAAPRSSGGVYGVPETFVVGRDAKIAFKLVGPITPEILSAP